MQSAIQMPASFLVHGNPVNAGVGKRGNELVWILDHQVAVKRQLRRLAQRLHHRRPYREVGNEVSIHDIHMDDTAATLGSGAHLLAQPGKISGENRRCQFDQSELSERSPRTMALARKLFPEILTR